MDENEIRELFKATNTTEPCEKRPEDYDLPPYPEGEVVGPCVCGSWPGGKCLRCRVVPNVQGKGLTATGLGEGNERWKVWER